MRMKRKVRTGLIWMGSIKALPSINIDLYTNPSYTVYRAWITEYSNGRGSFREIKSRSWKKFIKTLQKELASLSVYDVSTALWFGRYAWTQKNIYEYIMDY